MSIRKVLAALFVVFLSGEIILSGCAKKEEEVEKVIALEPLSDPLKIDTGYISGTLIGDIDNPIGTYRGIPYAAPPVGDLRWKPPQAAAPWDEIRQCTEFSKTSPQEAMMKMWTQFARTGDPNVEGMIQWPAYNKEDDKYMYFAEPLEIKTGFSKIKPASPL